MKKFILFCVICLLTCLAASPVFASGNIAKVLSYGGEVKIIKSGSTTGYDCETGAGLSDGDWLTTSKNSYVNIAFDSGDKNIAHVDSETLVAIRGDATERMEIFDGDMLLSLKGLRNGETFQVRIPSGVCGARGTGWAISTNGVMASVSVFDNEVYMKGLNKDGTISAGDTWTPEGYKREMKKYGVPGEAKKVADEVLENYRNKIAAVRGNVERTNVVKIGGSSSKDSFTISRRDTGIQEINGVGVNLQALKNKGYSHSSIINIGDDE